MNQQPSIEDRLRHALHDLDRRVADTVTVRQQAPVSLPRAAGPRPRNRWNLPRLVPALAALAVIAVLSATGWLLRPGSTGPAPIPGVTATATPTPSPVNSPAYGPDPATVLKNLPDVVSQSAAEGTRDGIYPDVAALHLPQRVVPDLETDDVVYTATPEGIWVISRPDFSGLAKDPNNNCLPKSAGIGYTICPGSYSEILLLASDGSTVLKAYPMPYNPAWLYVTPDAIYCGQRGRDDWIGMVCRIDRRTEQLTGGEFWPTGVDTGSAAFEGWPGDWKYITAPAGLCDYNRANLQGGALALRYGTGSWCDTALDGVTLEPLKPR